MLKSGWKLLVMGVLTLMVVSPVKADFLWGALATEDKVNNNTAPGAPVDGSTDSAAVGAAAISYNMTSGVLSYTIVWVGLEGDLTKIHIHGPAEADESTPTHLVEILLDEQAVIDAGVDRRNGSFSGEQVLEGHAGFTKQEVLHFMASGLSYVNIHSEAFPMGEIRANLPVVPEPASLGMMGMAAGSLMLVRRRRPVA